MSRFHSAVCLAFAVSLLVNIPGCGEQTEGFVYVDNGGTESIDVQVNGENVATIAPGKFEKVRLDLGTHHFRVTSGDSVIYDEKHTLDYGDRPFRRPTFVLNPDNSNRYCEVSIVYGDDSFSRNTADAMVTMISNAASMEAAGNADEAARRRRDLDRQNKKKFRSIKNDLAAFGVEPFFRFETYQNVLQPMPNVVFGSRHGSSSEESTLIRVSVEIHDAVEEILEVEDPTDEDLQRLILVHEIVQSLVSFRD